MGLVGQISRHFPKTDNLTIQKYSTQTGHPSQIRRQINNIPFQSTLHDSWCPCDGTCPKCASKNNNGLGLSSDLKVSQPDDPLEREADEIAEQAIPMRYYNDIPNMSNENTGVKNIHRKCYQCKEKDDEDVEKSIQISRKPDEDNSIENVRLSNESSDEINNVINSSGQPLNWDTKEFLESTLGYNIDGIRIHTDNRASRSAELLNARAYTVKNNIVIGEGEYSPDTKEGKKLLLHETVHTLQENRSPGNPRKIYRQARRHGKPGTSFSVDTPGTVTSSAVGKWKGSVKRERFESEASFKKKEKPIDLAWANLEFDENSCQVTIPVRVQFVNGPDHKLAESKFQSLSQQYIKVVNTMLNGWYSLTVDDCESFKCSGKQIPIRVEMKEAKGNPDYIVYFSSETRVGGEEARSYVYFRREEPFSLFSPSISSLLGLGSGPPTAKFYGGIDRYTMAHEAVHMALQFGDEYVETDPAFWRYPHVETSNEIDWSLAANQHAFGKWSLLHERHFNFAKVFLEEVLRSSKRPNCSVKLVELARPTYLYLNVLGQTGYLHWAGEHGLYLSGGLELGIPLNRLREWNLLLGLQGKLFGQLSGTHLKSAYLLGLRTGFEYRHTRSAGGFKLKGIAEAGYMKTSDLYEKGGKYPYGEFVGSIGYSAQHSLLTWQIELETAYGISLNINDSENQKWFRIGLNGGFSF